MSGSLSAQPLLLDLGPDVVSAGVVVADYASVVAELEDSSAELEGMPVKAVTKRRAEFLAGRFAARQALLGLGLSATPGRNEDGSPRWPADVAGSITHGAARALCAVARRGAMRSLGIDAENLMGEAVKDELLARICSPAERALLLQCAARPERHLVTIAFSAKESLYKCLYPLMGRYQDFNAARIVTVEATEREALLTGRMTLELARDWSPELTRGKRLDASFVASAQHVETAVLLRA